MAQTISSAKGRPAKDMDNSHPLKVLLVEDEREDAELIIRSIKSSSFGSAIELDWVNTPKEFEAASLDYDAYLVDLHIPPWSPEETLEHINKVAMFRPLIVISKESDVESMQESGYSGAQGYMFKDCFDAENLIHTLYCLQGRRAKQRETSQELLQKLEGP